MTLIVVENAPSGNNVQPLMFILKTKRDTNGELVHLKVMLVVLGNLQELKGNYAKIYALVAFTELIRVMLDANKVFGWDVKLVDVKGAFIYATSSWSDKSYVQLLHFDCMATIFGQIVRH